MLLPVEFVVQVAELTLLLEEGGSQQIAREGDYSWGGVKVHHHGHGVVDGQFVHLRPRL